MNLSLSHKNIGQLRFYTIDKTHYAGKHIRGAEISETTVFLGKIRVHELVTTSYSISYREYDFHKNALLQVKDSGQVIRMDIVLEGRFTIHYPNEQTRELSAGQYIVSSASSYTLGFTESDNCFLLSVALSPEPLLETGLIGTEILSETCPVAAKMCQYL